ncbi:hypothetical protein Scep_006068 [Stephania cephalantha]|uniref:Uncharacterized protein n=1 Tax=Stephania cephalantha TaxID=152367 RepID=A0AAP0PNN0_9MAGN
MADPTRQIDVAEDRDVVVVDSSLESSYLFELNLLTVLLCAASIPSSEETNCSDSDKKNIDVKNEGLNGGDGERRLSTPPRSSKRRREGVNGFQLEQRRPSFQMRARDIRYNSLVPNL